MTAIFALDLKVSMKKEKSTLQPSRDQCNLILMDVQRWRVYLRGISWGRSFCLGVYLRIESFLPRSPRTDLENLKQEGKIS